MSCSADQPVAYENKECQVLFWRRHVFKIIQVHSHGLPLDFLLMLTHKGVLENHTSKSMLILLPWVLLMILINTSDSIYFLFFFFNFC